MNRFAEAFVPPEEREIFADDLVAKWKAGDPEIVGMFPRDQWSEQTLRLHAMRVWNDEHDGVHVFLNDTYQVARRSSEHGAIVHLSIKRIDREPIHDWRDFQEIKNQLIGPECEAIELYPAESRLVDTSNQYHLWAIADPTFRFPMGFLERSVSNGNIGKSKQRPRSDLATSPQ